MREYRNFVEFTKRSKGFREKITAYVQKLSTFLPGPTEWNYPDQLTIKLSREELEEVILILEKHTHDDPTLVKVHEDEAIFVLRAQDQSADQVVEGWAWLFLQRAMDSSPSSIHAAFQQMGKCKVARMIAEAMRKFPKRKFPD